MLQPAQFDLSADRWVMCRRTFAFVGYDFTGATFKMEIRQTKDTGSALVSLTTQTTDVQGIRRTYTGTDTIANLQASGYLADADVNALLGEVNPATDANYALTDSILLTVLAIRIDDATMNGLPFPDAIAEGQRGDSTVLYYDLQITPSGGDQDVYAKGQFIVLAGVTQ